MAAAASPRFASENVVATDPVSAAAPDGPRLFRFYLTLYLDNALTGGEWYPKKTYGDLVTVEDWLNFATDLLVPAAGV